MTVGCMDLTFGKPYHNKSTAECRVLGRRGGLRSARNRRLRRLAELSRPATSAPESEPETAHEASLLLDARFPHLRNAWVRITQPAA